jgi:hypothetical protein
MPGHEGKIMRTRAIRSASAALLLALALAGGPQPAVAAVRVCKAPVASAIGSDPVEARARAKAIASWTDKAKAAGTQNATWRIASRKVLRCARLPAGKFDCVALAEPCTISQIAPPVPKRSKTKEKPIST